MSRVPPPDDFSLESFLSKKDAAVPSWQMVIPSGSRDSEVRFIDSRTERGFQPRPTSAAAAEKKPTFPSGENFGSHSLSLNLSVHICGKTVLILEMERAKARARWPGPNFGPKINKPEKARAYYYSKPEQARAHF